MSGAATPERLDELHAALGRLWERVDRALPEPPDAAWRSRFDIAVAEVGSNIVRHAYPPQTQPGTMTLALRAFPGRIEAQFVDRGVAYKGAARAAASAGDDLPELAEGGYGLALVHASVDEVDYVRTAGGRNEWRLVKRL